MQRLLVALCVPLTVSCAVGLDVPDTARITCSGDTQCPSGYECAEELAYCITKGTNLPRLSVSFTQPRDGDLEVSLTTRIVIVLNMDATPPPAELITLRATDGTDDVPVTFSSSGTANTLVIEPRRLFPTHEYALTIKSGIAPATGVFGAPSDHDTVVKFTTTISSDISPPDPTIDFIVQHETDRTTVDWSYATDPDKLAAVLMRLDDSGTVPTLEAGRSYIAGEVIGGAELIYIGRDSTFDDVTTPTSTRYAIAAFDGSLNYSSVAVSPVYSDASVTWCPGGMGTFSVTSSDAGSQQLFVAPSATTPLAIGTFYPSLPVSVGTTTSFTSGGPFFLDATVIVRPVVRSSGGIVIGPPSPLQLSRDDFSSVVVNGTPGLVTEPVTLPVWPAFDVQVVRQLDGTATAGHIEGASAVAYIPVPGTYQLRIRPRAPGCALTAFTLSDPFTIGGSSCYVREGPSEGDGSASGPYGGITSCDQLASVVYVAAGTYPALSARDGVTYLGGYNASFTQRNPTTFETKLTATGTALSLDGDRASVVDGFRIDSPGEVGTKFGAVHIDAGTTKLSILGNSVVTNTGSGAALTVLASSFQSIGNTLTGPIGVIATNASAKVPVFEDTIVRGTSSSAPAFSCVGARVDIHGGAISNQTTATTGTSTALALNDFCRLEVDSVSISATTSPTATNVTSRAIAVSWGLGHFANNRISAGVGASTAGVLVQTTSNDVPLGDIIFVDNTIYSGAGTVAQPWGSGRTGFLFASSVTASSHTIRLANNLIVGDGSFGGMAVQNSFPKIASIQNNVTVGATAFFVSYDTAPSSADLATAEANACGMAPPSVMTNNAFLPAGSIFVNAGGADTKLATLDDNDWHLTSAAPATIRHGGLPFTGGQDCGGATCGAPLNASCGITRDDFSGALRGAPSSVGAYAP